MSSLSLVSVAEALVPQVLADKLLSFCKLTGQSWGPNPQEELFWYRPPKVHILEFIILHIFIFACFWASWGYRTQAIKNIQKISNGISTKSHLNRFLWKVFLLCWLLQVFFKAIRPQPFVQMGWLLMPCHLITLLWILVLRREGKSYYALNVYLATLATDYHWGPIGAVLAPDFDDHQYRIEAYVFIIHHGLLLIMPFYFATRYQLLSMNFKHLLHVTGVAALINIGPYTLHSYLSGLNLNYMLYPPLKLMKIFPFNSIAYRWYVIILLIFLILLLHIFINCFGKCMKLILIKINRRRKVSNYNNISNRRRMSSKNRRNNGIRKGQ